MGNAVCTSSPSNLLCKLLLSLLYSVTAPEKSNHEPGNVPKPDFTPKSQPSNVTDGIPRHEHTWTLSDTRNEELPNMDLNPQNVKLDINSLLKCLLKQIAQPTLGRADLGGDEQPGSRRFCIRALPWEFIPAWSPALGVHSSLESSLNAQKLQDYLITTPGLTAQHLPAASEATPRSMPQTSSVTQIN